MRSCNDKVISLYARGLSTRAIQAHLAELYGVEGSPALMSEITAAVVEDVRAWRARPLEPVYPILYRDALMVKMRHDGRMANRAVYLAIGVTLEGAQEVLGLWTSASAGTKFRLGVLTELRNRGVQEVLVASVDGLKGFPEAITAVYPRAEVQLCVVHLVRNSLAYVGWQERQAAAGLKEVYRAATAEQAARRLAECEVGWGARPGERDAVAAALGRG